MDRNLHTDDFVRLLREKSDEFRMYPSKRIWFSIYNNIHPCRKWPSVAMSITLISALLLVGYLNTNNAASSSAKEKSSQVNTDNSNISLETCTRIVFTVIQAKILILTGCRCFVVIIK